ncbi:16369_t:CDS:1, partial [Racocetra fulgida]
MLRHWDHIPLEKDYEEITIWNKDHPDHNRFREYLEQEAETDTDYSQNQEVKNNIKSEQIKYIVKQN